MAAALRQQYGLRVNSDEFREMPWCEFSDLIGGLTDRTALANLALVRTTTDKETLKQLTPEQRRERANWQRRRAHARSDAENAQQLAMLQQAIANAFGGERHGG